MIAVGDASLPLDGQGALVLTWGADLTESGITTTVLPASQGYSFEGFVNNGNLPGQRVVVSTGIVAVTSVPEPGSWALMVAGLATLIGRSRRRLRLRQAQV
jgi:hypothetical protein